MLEDYLAATYTFNTEEKRMDVGRPYRFLLIGGLRDPWRVVLEEALLSLGTLKTIPEIDMGKFVSQTSYDVIIVDAVQVRDVPLLIALIRKQQTGAKVAVVTASPTWRRARKAFRAGAIDYIPKTMDKDEMVATFQIILGKPPPNQDQLS